MMVSRVLKKLNNELGNLDIQEVDVLRHPRTALQAGITMIPALQMGEQRISGLFLSEQKIRDFLQHP